MASTSLYMSHHENLWLGISILSQNKKRLIGNTNGLCNYMSCHCPLQLGENDMGLTIQKSLVTTHVCCN
jgi:hypothetical protein